MSLPVHSYFHEFTRLGQGGLRARLRSMRGKVATIGYRLQLCLQRRKERRALRGLAGDELRDVGLSRDDVARETRRWPWDGKVR